jgi:hypothetical protein
MSIKFGDKGPAVLALQTQLKNAKFDPGPLDSVFGQKVLDAVEAYQHANGLNVDGIVGPLTTASLNAYVPTAPQPPVAGAPFKLPWESGHPGRAAWTAFLRAQIESSEITQIELADGSILSPNYHKMTADQRVQRWCELCCRIVLHESDYNPMSVYHEPPPLGVDSIGLFQLSYEDQGSYHLPIKLSKANGDLTDPMINIQVAVFIMHQLVAQNGRLAGKVDGHWQGLARYWSTMRDTEQPFHEISSYLAGLK